MFPFLRKLSALLGLLSLSWSFPTQAADILRSGSFSTFHTHKHTIRYASFPAHGTSKADILLLEGRATFIEYYQDLILLFQKRGYTVWVMDWLGQGGSDRTVPEEPRKQHILSFDTYLETLTHWVHTVIKPSKPVLLLGYSMGGFAALRWAQDHPTQVKGVIALAPMLGLNTYGVPQTLVRMFVNLSCSLGFEQSFVWGQSASTSAERWPLSLNPFTRDPQGFSEICALNQAHTAMTVGGITFGWLRAAFNAIDALMSASRQPLQTPVLMVSGGKDPIVDGQAHHQACQRLPRCTLVVEPEARHEMFRETKAIRHRLWQAMDDFLNRLEKEKKP